MDGGENERGSISESRFTEGEPVGGDKQMCYNIELSLITMATGVTPPIIMVTLPDFD